MKGGYEEFHALKAAENKPNSKPNKANMPAFGWELEAADGQIVNSKLVPAKAGIVISKSGVSPAMRFEKTKPIWQGVKLC